MTAASRAALRARARRLAGGKGAFVVALIAARGGTALASLLLFWRLQPAALGGYNYLQATAAVPVALFAFGIDVAINATLQALPRDHADDRGTIRAGLIVVAIGTVLAAAATLVLLLIASNPATAPVGAAATLLALFCLVSFLNLLANGIAYAMDRYGLVARASLLTAALWIVFALAAPRGTGSQAIMAAFAACNAAGVVATLAGLRSPFRHAFSGGDAGGVRAATVHLLRYGGTMGLSGALTLLALWAIQARVSAGQGLAANALYGMASQLFNLAIFVPQVANPLILAAMNRPGARTACVRMAGLLGAAMLAAAGAAWIVLPLLERSLPPAYAGIRTVATIALAGAALAIARTPLTLFFAARLRPAPELVATVVGMAVVLAALAVVPAPVPAVAMAIRVVGYAAALLVTGAIFARGDAAGAS